MAEENDSGANTRTNITIVPKIKSTTGVLSKTKKTVIKKAVTGQSSTIPERRVISSLCASVESNMTSLAFQHADGRGQRNCVSRMQDHELDFSFNNDNKEF